MPLLFGSEPTLRQVYTMSRTEPTDVTRLERELQTLRRRLAELERYNRAGQSAEQALQHSEELNRRIIQSMLGGLVLVGLDGAIVSANAEAERILGLAFEELNSRYVPDFGTMTIHPDGRPYAVDDYPVSRCLKTGQPQPPVTIGIKHRDGHVIWAVYSAAPLTDPATGQQTGAVVNFIDVTEQRQFQMALEDSELRYRLLFESNPHPMWVFDEKTLEILAVNDAAIHHYGYTRDEFLKLKITDLRPPQDVPALLERLATLHEPMVRAGVHRHVKKDHTQIDVEISSHALEFLGRSARLVLATDVTERRRAEEALRASEEQYRRLIEGVRMIAWEYDLAEHRYLFVSNHAEDVLGYPLSEWHQRDFWSSHVHPDDRARAEAFSHEQVERSTDHEFEYRMVHASGRDVWFKDITTVVTHEGKPRRLRGVLIDITERKLAEERLRIGEEKYRALVETTGTGYVTLDMRGRVLDANDEFVRLTGHRSLVDIRGHAVTEWTAPHDQKRNAESVKMCLERGEARNLEIDYIDSKGRVTPVEINATVMRLQGQPVILGLCRDISARREAEKALRESTQVHRMMLSELDHRVRNNLASLAALIDISRSKQQTVAEFATSIRGRVQAMAAVHSMLSRARWVAVDLRAIVETVVPYDAKQRVQMNGPEVLITPRQVTALGMMLQELLANSLKHGALKGQGSIVVAWHIAEEQGDDRILNLTWKELNGPEITTVPTPAQGTSLIQGFVRTELRGEARLNYPQSGAFHEFVLRLDRAESR